MPDFVEEASRVVDRAKDKGELGKKIERMMIEQVQNMRNCIFNFHCPPYDTSLDLALKLEKDLKAVVSGGQMMMEHVGSVAIRKAIDEHQPILGMHGHIHESVATFNVRRTLY